MPVSRDDFVGQAPVAQKAEELLEPWRTIENQLKGKSRGPGSFAAAGLAQEELPSVRIDLAGERRVLGVRAFVDDSLEVRGGGAWVREVPAFFRGAGPIGGSWRSVPARGAHQRAEVADTLRVNVGRCRADRRRAVRRRDGDGLCRGDSHTLVGEDAGIHGLGGGVSDLVEDLCALVGRQGESQGSPGRVHGCANLAVAEENGRVPSCPVCVHILLRSATQGDGWRVELPR